MERIVIEVDEATARNWKSASHQKRKTISYKVSLSINKELMKDRREDFLRYIEELRDKMEDRGLTQEVLDEILKDE